MAGGEEGGGVVKHAALEQCLLMTRSGHGASEQALLLCG